MLPTWEKHIPYPLLFTMSKRSSIFNFFNTFLSTKQRFDDYANYYYYYYYYYYILVITLVGVKNCPSTKNIETNSEMVFE